jgi:hypothetical protein
MQARVSRSIAWHQPASARNIAKFEGAALPSLQPGASSTDLILGAFEFGPIGTDWSWFARASLRHAVWIVDDDAPGDVLSLASWLRNLDWDKVMPQVQLHVRRAAIDRNSNAATFAIASTLACITPAVVLPVAAATTVYAFAQLPLYQNRRGVELAPRAITSIGLHTSL